MMGRALSLFLGGKFKTPGFKKLMEELENRCPGFAPIRFLKNEYMAAIGSEPRLIQKASLILLDEKRAKIVVEFSAVLVPVSPERASVVFVDNNTRVTYGELYVSGPNRDQFINQFVSDVMTSIRAVYHQDAINAIRQTGGFPLAAPTLQKIRDIIALKVKEGSSSAESFFNR
jgi:hypothetical protein